MWRIAADTGQEHMGLIFQSNIQTDQFYWRTLENPWRFYVLRNMCQEAHYCSSAEWTTEWSDNWDYGNAWEFEYKRQKETVVHLQDFC